MNKKIRRMMQEIRRRGGLVNVNGSVPDDVAERFLREVLSCPDCQAQAHDAAADTGFAKDVPIDKIIAATTGAKKANEN
jgi:hypothetical protein